MCTVIGVQIRPTVRTLAFAEYFNNFYYTSPFIYNIPYEKIHMYMYLYTSTEIVGVSI